MKTNAIIRIIIWSLVIVTLLGILTAGMNTGKTWKLPSRTIAASPAETAIPQRVEPTAPDTAAAPSPTSAEPNFIDSASAEPDSVEPSTVPVPIAEDIDNNATTIDSIGIREIKIEWVAGEIQILPSEENVIRITESGDNTAHPMVVKQKNEKLTIQYSKETNVGIGITINDVIQKDLTILVPKDLYLKELELDVASAVVLVKDMNIQEVDFDGASGTCEFVSCNVNSLDIDTASGDVVFTGTLDELECDAASASFKGTLTNVPRRMEMDSMSGNLEVTLPADAGFTVTLEAMNSDFSSDFETTGRNGSFVHGDGSCRIKMDAMSGDVIIHKGK